MDHRRVSRQARAAVTAIFLVAAGGSAIVACGGKAVVDGTSGAGGQGGAASTTVAPPTTSSTTTPTPTSECGRASLDLWNCTQQGDLCPGLAGADAGIFVAEWEQFCAGAPAFVALVEASESCAQMVGGFLSVSPDFADSCLGVDTPAPDDEGA